MVRNPRSFLLTIPHYPTINPKPKISCAPHTQIVFSLVPSKRCVYRLNDTGDAASSPGPGENEPYERIIVADLDPAAMRAVAERIQRLSDEHWWLLTPTCRLMESDTWVGPSGRRFDTQVHTDQRELHTLLKQAVDSANRKLASTPAEP
jgi:hypothetical protein